jgi:hypothetical protein
MPIPSSALALTLLAAPADPTGPVALELTIENHRLAPETLIAPASKRLELRVTNRDSTSEEIESYALNREKIVRPGKTVVIYLGPLAPGRYDLYGEDHPETAQAVLEVR